MELVRPDTRRAYELIRDKITTLELAPGSAISVQKLAQELQMGAVPVEEALKALAHDDLVVVTPRHGIYVTDVNLADLQALSETRLPLEALSAGLAAQRATADDLLVLRALCKEQRLLAEASTEAPVKGNEYGRDLFALDHRFHQAIADAAHNRYLARALEHFFNLSQRLWFMALPQLDFLPTAVEEHVALVDAIEAGDSDQAETLMHDHVQEFYDRVRTVLKRGLLEEQ